MDDPLVETAALNVGLPVTNPLAVPLGSVQLAADPRVTDRVLLLSDPLQVPLQLIAGIPGGLVIDPVTCQ